MSPRERLEFLIEAREVLDGQIRELRWELGLTKKRPRNVIPECPSETAYQRHMHRKRKFDEPVPDDCGCRAAHAEHVRLWSAS